MSLTLRYRKEVLHELTDMVKEYVAEEMIDQRYVETFNAEFYLKIGRAGCTGGIDRVWRPTIKMSTSERYFDREGWLAWLRAMKGTPRQTVWRKAKEYAEKDRWYHVEYARIHTDPEIGSFLSDNYEDHVLCSLLHEFAHVVTLYNWSKTRTPYERHPQPHGTVWRRHYRTLRNEFHNEWLK